jgi:hypothetical protein
MSDKQPELILDNIDNISTRREVIFENSTTLNAGQYDAAMQTLTLQFKTSSGRYSYFDVPSDVAYALFALAKDGSAGKYFIKHIKHNYPFKKIT